MKKTLILLTLTTALTACATVRDSRVNPLNWFDRDKAATTSFEEELKPLVPESKVVTTIDTRPQIASVSSVEVAPAQGGFLVTATGLPSQAGGFNADLVPTGQDGGVLTLSFRIVYPDRAVTGRATAVNTARFFSNGDYPGVSSVRVTGQSNSVTRRR